MGYTLDTGFVSPLAARVLIFVGALTTFHILYNTVRFLLSTFVVPGSSLNSFKSGKSSSTWAVITGASDGIGKEYALQLAAKGFSVLLVSRTKSKLDVLKGEIEQKSKKGDVKAETLAIDFLKASEADYARLTQALDGKAVGVLVNNVGLSHEMPVRFEDVETAELEGIVKVNCLATLRVTGCVLPCKSCLPNTLV